MILLRGEAAEYLETQEHDKLTQDNVYGYAYIYASFYGTDVSDITISFTVTKYPRNLIKHLKKRGFTVKETESGIYHVEAYTQLKKFESKNAYLDRIIKANKDVFKEVFEVSDTAVREFVALVIAEDSGLLDEWGQKRDIERAKIMARKMQK